MSIYAKVIASTINPNERTSRITTIEYRAPRFLLAEINTHGVLAKSAQSSRAVPVKRRIEMVEEMPYVPTFGKNKRGMQADELLDENVQMMAKNFWAMATADAVRWAKLLSQIEAHKQDANRVLEPYAYVVGLFTATEWDNFYNLRISEEAQPAFKELATAVKEAIDNYIPEIDYLHLPYVGSTHAERNHNQDMLLNVSAARCARVSYTLFDNEQQHTMEVDLELAQRLLKVKHMSPFEHAAFADTVLTQQWNAKRVWQSPVNHGRYWGWVSNRVMVEKQLGIKSRRSSFDPL